MAKGMYPNKAAQSVAEFRREVEPSSVTLEKGKSGRPTKGKVHKISLSIPIELYEGVEFASYFFRENITAYINSLIRRDLERNLDKYQEFRTMMDDDGRNEQRFINLALGLKDHYLLKYKKNQKI